MPTKPFVSTIPRASMRPPLLQLLVGQTAVLGARLQHGVAARAAPRGAVRPHAGVVLRPPLLEEHLHLLVALQAELLQPRAAARAELRQRLPLVGVHDGGAGAALQVD